MIDSRLLEAASIAAVTTVLSVGVLRLGDVARDLSLWAAAAVAVFAAAIFYT
jgi:hypothetical protein